MKISILLKHTFRFGCLEQ